MMDHNSWSVGDWPGDVCLRRCVVFFVAQVVNAADYLWSQTHVC